MLISFVNFIIRFGITKVYRPLRLDRCYHTVKRNKIEIGLKKAKCEGWPLLHNDGYSYVIA